MPLVLVLVALVAYPFFSGIVLSFQNKTIGGDARWVGLANYRELLFGGSVAFFNWARIGRRPLWLWHRLRSLVESGYRGRSLGCDHRKRREQLPFIIDAEEHEDLASASLLA